MPTRLYLRNPGAAGNPIAPAYDAAWEGHGGNRRNAMSLTKANTGVNAYADQGSGTTGNYDQLYAQFVSLETFEGSKTISGTFSAVLAARGGSPCYLQAVIKVVASDAVTERGTLYAGSTYTASVATVNAPNQSFPGGTSWRVLIDLPCSPVDVQAGDYLVAEFGFRNTSTSYQEAAMRTGDPTTGDAELSAASAYSTTLATWIEFSEDNLFSGTPEPTVNCVKWWDGVEQLSATLKGWWDGAAIQPATLLGWWDGAAIQPLAECVTGPVHDGTLATHGYPTSVTHSKRGPVNISGWADTYVDKIEFILSGHPTHIDRSQETFDAIIVWSLNPDGTPNTIDDYSTQALYDYSLARGADGPDIRPNIRIISNLRDDFGGDTRVPIGVQLRVYHSGGNQPIGYTDPADDEFWIGTQILDEATYGNAAIPFMELTLA